MRPTQKPKRKQSYKKRQHKLAVQNAQRKMQVRKRRRERD